jgi:hypothetical protein
VATYDLGDGVPLEHEVYDADRELTTATVTLALTRPDGTSFTAPTITNPSTGIYRAVPVPDVVGIWSGAWSTSGAVTSVTPFAFTVGDPAPALYTDLATVKSSIGKTTGDERDDLIEQAIAAASRMIDERCGRRFYAPAGVTARIFPALDRHLTVGDAQSVRVDDIATDDGLVVETRTGFTGTWTTITGAELGPDNADVYGRPWTEVVYTAGWIGDTSKVRVTARWGWPAVPDGVTQAAALLAARLYRRKDSPQGILGSADWGVIRVSRFDPDVESLIAPYILITA